MFFKVDDFLNKPNEGDDVYQTYARKVNQYVQHFKHMEMLKKTDLVYKSLYKI